MGRESVEKLVEKLVTELLSESALELVDVEYVRERDWILRVFLDKEGGIEIEDCQWVSERLEARLDELDPIKESYYLEVSSPGLDRPLKKDRDFVRYTGEMVEVHLFAPLDGHKLLTGSLLGLENDSVCLEIDSQKLAIPREKISQVRRYFEF
ncbi:MAG TPA: ribosome maturation factor RimP [Patescibacteria group bacterium]|nr:ribosome maturation factor RimP [Patescibacteria group bacterium]